MLDFVAASAKGRPVDWHAFKARFGSSKRLRNVLKGLLRTGQLEQDGAGRYHLPGKAGAGLTAAVEADAGGRGRLLGKRLSRDGLAARPGDVVEYVVEGDEIRVLDILEHAATPVIGVLTRTRWGGYITSLAPEYRGRVAIEDVPAGIPDGTTVSVRVTDRDRRGLRGNLLDVVAAPDVADAAAESLLAAHRVPVAFPEDALEQAADLPEKIQTGRYRSRLDLRETPLVTIDGADARDFDDAVYAEPHADGGWRLLVAIADVAHYVRPGAPLDNSARERGTSVYLPHRVVPMLPEKISNGLCSLVPNQARLALVCEVHITRNGQLGDYAFHEALIRSWARLTYTRVAEWIEQRDKLAEFEGGERIRKSLTHLHAMFRALVKAREKRGALEFETRSGRLVLENGRVASIEEVTRNDAHRLIEEAMIAANVCAARFIASRDARALYRVHEPPQHEKKEVLRDALAFAGIRARELPSEPKALAKLLAPVRGRKDAWLINNLLLRAMSQACYQPENRGHFGLALTEYMHFTSPIRRYPDLIVHRVVKALVRGKRPPLQGFDALVQMGESTSGTERRAEEVERGVSAWLKCEHLTARIGETFQGIVVGVADFGLFVELDGYFVQGLVHVSNLGEDYYEYVAAAQALVGERSGSRFALGDEFEVRLEGTEPAQGRLDLSLASKPRGRRRRR
ncbi:MAG: ribonuclease R [Pseudomonadota bacterium]